MASTKGNLLGSTVRVQTPYIEVTFGDLNSGYTFGVYRQAFEEKTDKNNNKYKIRAQKFPNFIQKLSIVKINGQVNQYNLEISYPVRVGHDPNYFDKLFSSISKTRKIFFTYGDMSVPDYVYRQEEAIITDIQTSFDLRGSTINYTITAVSSAKLACSGATVWGPYSNTKPSTIITDVLLGSGKLQDIFYGMKNLDEVKKLGLIYTHDAAIDIPVKSMSALDYLRYLVSIMHNESESNATNQYKTVCALTIHDTINGTAGLTSTQQAALSEGLGGPFFKVSPITANIDKADAYEIDIGFPSGNLVTQFSIDNQETYSLYYDYQGKLSSDMTVGRINDKGQLENVFSPTISSVNENFTTNESDKVWWSKVTQFPISASITITGLLRPAMLMDYVRLNVVFPGGRKHNSSGLYIVTKQTDSISGSGFTTKLNLTRVKGDAELL